MGQHQTVSKHETPLLKIVRHRTQETQLSCLIVSTADPALAMLMRASMKQQYLDHHVHSFCRSLHTICQHAAMSHIASTTAQNTHKCNATQRNACDDEQNIQNAHNTHSHTPPSPTNGLPQDLGSLMHLIDESLLVPSLTTCILILIPHDSIHSVLRLNPLPIPTPFGTRTTLPLIPRRTHSTRSHPIAR